MSTIRIGGLVLEHFMPAVKKYTSPLLFIHGMYGGSSSFYWWARYAAEAGREVWALNLRGHHGSRPGENFGNVSLMDHVEDVRDVLAYIGPAIPVGHSMGALITQIAAHRWLIPAMVLCNSAAPRGIFPGSWATISRYWKPRYLAATTLNKPLHPHKGDTMSLVLNNMSPEEAEEIFSRCVPESGRAVRQTTLWPVLGRELKIYCPILVIGASNDRLTPVRIQRAIARKYNADYQEFPGAHMLPLEKGWEAPIKFILNWAAEHAL